MLPMPHGDYNWLVGARVIPKSIGFLDKPSC